MNKTTHDIIDALATKVRCMTSEQVNQLYSILTGEEEPRTPAIATRLVRDGWFADILTCAPRPLRFVAPLVHWKPGDAHTDPEQLAYHAQSRMRQPEWMTAYVATKRARNAFGGVDYGGLGAPVQIAHDLNVAQVFLHFLEKDYMTLERWLSEDLADAGMQLGPGIKLPDAFLVYEDERRPLAIEHLGQFHPDCLRDMQHQFERVMQEHVLF